MTIRPGSGQRIVLMPKANGEAFATFVVNQKEICSEEAPQGIDCQDHLVGAFWPGKPRVSGRVEADVISGIMIELEIWAGIN